MCERTKGRSLSTLGTLCASILRNLLESKGVTKAGEVAIRTDDNFYIQIFILPWWVQINRNSLDTLVYEWW